MQELKLTGFVIGYTSWDDLDANHDRIKEALRDFSGVTVLKAYNQAAEIDTGIQFPWSLALIVKDGPAMKALDDFLVKKNVGLGENKEIYVGKPRVADFFRMMIIGKYPPGMLMIRFKRCPYKSIHLNACMFCPTGHMLECHYPNTCEEANCSHYQREMGVVE